MNCTLHSAVIVLQRSRDEPTFVVQATEMYLLHRCQYSGALGGNETLLARLKLEGNLTAWGREGFDAFRGKRRTLTVHRLAFP